MTDRQSVLDRISALFLRHLSIEVPSEDVDLLDTGVLDSLTLVQLLLHIEEDFGVQISVEDVQIDNFRSLSRITELILSYNGIEASA
jgi:D-alanine--poly(phosphoribitol) ligase subunit 2